MATSRAVRVEVGLTVPTASTLAGLVTTLRASSPLLGAVESRPTCTYRRAWQERLGQTNWQLTPSPSSRPSRNEQKVFKSFRLISPLLKTEQDGHCCSNFLKAIQEGVVATLNSTTGLRVHVDMAGIGFEGSKKVCQNFVKYEDAIDSLLPPSRRTGSSASQSYFQSNKEALQLLDTKKKRNDAIGACENMESLVLLLNPDGTSNYKLNIRNNSAANGSPRVEFRGHSSTTDPNKIVAWMTLCQALVATAADANHRPCTALKESRSLDEEVEALFQHVVKKASVREYYQQRRADLAAASSSQRTGAKRGRRSQGEPRVNSTNKTAKRRECGCCLETFATSTMCPCQARNHWFCQSCVRMYAETQIFSNMTSKMQCIAVEGCTSHLNTIHLKRAVPKKVTERLYELQYLESVERDKKVSRYYVSW